MEMETPVNTRSTPVRIDVKKHESRILKKEIKGKLFQFKYNDLMDGVILDLFEIDPAEMKEKLDEYKLPLTKFSVAELLINRARGFNNGELKDINFLLQLYRTALYYKLKKWSPVILLEPEDDLKFHDELQIIKHNIIRAFHTKGLNAIVHVISHDGLVWVMIVEKKLRRNKGIKLQAPVFICYEVGAPYIFKASAIPEKTLQCVLKAMQYKSHKMHHLQGRDVKSLLALLKHKAANSNALALAVYQPIEAKEGHRHVDFTKKKSRASYANKLFTAPDPVSLETFTVTADAEWRVNELVPEMVGEPFVALMHLHSKNVLEMVKYCVVNDMVATPLPEYIKSIMRSAKNNIVMRVPHRLNRTK